MATKSFVLQRYSTLKSFNAHEQSIQCNIDQSSVCFSTKNDITPKTQPSLIPSFDLFLNTSKTDNFFKKYSSPVHPIPKYMKAKSQYSSKNSLFASRVSSKHSVRRKLKIIKSTKSEEKAKNFKESRSECKFVNPLKQERKTKSIMDYYKELVVKPKVRRRTLYNHHKEVSSQKGFRTKLQKDPKIIRDSFGKYTYSDTYLLDAKKQAKIIIALN
jgi:hypothetical protein